MLVFLITVFYRQDHDLQADVATVRLSSDKLLPGIGALVDDLLGVPIDG